MCGILFPQGTGNETPPQRGSPDSGATISSSNQSTPLAIRRSQARSQLVAGATHNNVVALRNAGSALRSAPGATRLVCTHTPASCIHRATEHPTSQNPNVACDPPTSVAFNAARARADGGRPGHHINFWPGVWFGCPKEAPQTGHRHHQATAPRGGHHFIHHRGPP